MVIPLVAFRLSVPLSVPFVILEPINEPAPPPIKSQPAFAPQAKMLPLPAVIESPVEPAIPLIVSLPWAYTWQFDAPLLVTAIMVPALAGGSRTLSPLVAQTAMTLIP